MIASTKLVSHTPGPWKVKIADHDYTSFRLTEDGYPLRPDSIEQAWANARLIAAAPELLEALQDILAATPKNRTAYPDGPCLEPHLYDQAKAAIVKAEGR